MAVSDNEKELLKSLKTRYNSLIADPESVKIQKTIDEVRLDNISALDLKLLCKPEFVIGIDFNAIDTSPPFTAADMNEIAPGAIDIDKLRHQMMFGDHVFAASTEILDTQSGKMAVVDESIMNTDIETLVESKTISQGLNLNMINTGKNINKEETSNSPIPSRFVEET